MLVGQERNVPARDKESTGFRPYLRFSSMPLVGRDATRSSPISHDTPRKRSQKSSPCRQGRPNSKGVGKLSADGINLAQVVINGRVETSHLVVVLMTQDILHDLRLGKLQKAPGGCGQQDDEGEQVEDGSFVLDLRNVDASDRDERGEAAVAWSRPRGPQQRRGLVWGAVLVVAHGESRWGTIRGG